MTTINKILRIDASARTTGSITRDLADEAMDHFGTLGSITVARRDVASGLPFVDEDWVGANFTRADQRTVTQQAKLALSDTLIAEIEAADTLIIGAPVYNFGIPATLKAWIDMIARAGVTFRYTDTGPVGLLKGKRAIVLVASGGTPMGSELDFATPYLRHALGFIGIDDVTFIAADGLGREAAEKIAAAKAEIAKLQAA